MHRLILQPTSMAQWHQVVTEAQKEVSVNLEEELESYLVFLLERFTKETELLHSVLAIEFLNSLKKMPFEKKYELQTVGDKCLLVSGLFPRRARSRRVKVSYYVDLGRTAYSHLADLNNNCSSELYQGLSDNFVNLLDVLYAVRANGDANLDLIEAEELWSDTGSFYAKKVLQESIKGSFILQNIPKDNPH